MGQLVPIFFLCFIRNSTSSDKRHIIYSLDVLSVTQATVSKHWWSLGELTQTVKIRIDLTISWPIASDRQHLSCDDCLEKLVPLGRAVARVFPNVSLALCPQNSIWPPLFAGLWRRYCGKNVSEMTYSVSSGKLNLNSINQSNNQSRTVIANLRLQ